MSSAPLLVTVIAAGIVYHLAQKLAVATTPWSMLAIAYATALTLTIVLAIASGNVMRLPARGEWIAGLLIGLAAFGIEAGFFFIYRSGWPLASASVIASVSVTAILAIIGIVAFGEQMTASRAVGLVLAASGATLIVRG
jgi:drug/metabolite transporter (DMT)-like permease